MLIYFLNTVVECSKIYDFEKPLQKAGIYIYKYGKIRNKFKVLKWNTELRNQLLVFHCWAYSAILYKYVTVRTLYKAEPVRQPKTSHQICHSTCKISGKYPESILPHLQFASFPVRLKSNLCKTVCAISITGLKILLRIWVLKSYLLKNVLPFKIA